MLQLNIIDTHYCIPTMINKSAPGFCSVYVQKMRYNNMSD